jgi:PKD repeat protein/predicted AlkP superfamily pyrophosphatase or phosphodiesterase
MGGFMKEKTIILMIITIFLLLDILTIPVNISSTIINSKNTLSREHEPEPKRIILIGWDGVQRNHLQEMLKNPENLPNLRKLSREGNFIDIDVTSGNTATKAGWTQILTGYDPEITGAYSNVNYHTIPEGYTIFERLNKNFGNDSTYTMMVTGKSGHIGSEPGFPFYNAKNHIDGYELNVEREAKDVWPLAKIHLNEYVVNHTDEHLFAFIHFREPDYNGHFSGEYHENYSRDIRLIDGYLGKIVNFLKNNNIYDGTLIYVTSDHGFDNRDAPFPTDLDFPGRMHKMSPYTFLATNDFTIIRDGDRKDVAPTILNQFGLNINQIKPPLSGLSLNIEKEPKGLNDDVKINDNIKNILIISWSAVSRNHLEPIINEKYGVHNLKKVIDQGMYVDIDSSHIQGDYSMSKDFNVSYNLTLFGTDSTCGTATLLTGYDPEITGIYHDYRFGTISKGYTIFERLKNYLGTDKITNFMITGADNETGGGSLPYQNAKRMIDFFQVNIEPNDVGLTTINYLENLSTEHFFGFVHFSFPDLAGHEFGENSIEYDEAIEKCDYWLGKITQKLLDLGINQETLLYVTSTNGFDEEDVRFPVFPINPGHNHTHAPYLFLATNDEGILRHGNQRDFAPTIYHRFGLDLEKLEPLLPGKSLVKQYFNQPPNASFYSSKIEGYKSFALSFNDESTDPDGFILSFHWDFGDGNSSNEPNPIYLFDKSRIYEVTLTVTDDDMAIDKKTITVTGRVLPIASIKADKVSGKEPLTIVFFGQGFDSDGEIISYKWNFGNNESSNQQNIAYIFENSGVYNVTLIVTDNDGDKGIDFINVSVYSESLDTDNDDLPDWYEYEYGLNPNYFLDAAGDFDNDGYSNKEEFKAGTSPIDPKQFPKKKSDSYSNMELLLIIGTIIFIIIFFLINYKFSKMK